MNFKCIKSSYRKGFLKVRLNKHTEQAAQGCYSILVNSSLHKTLKWQILCWSKRKVSLTVKSFQPCWFAFSVTGFLHGYKSGLMKYIFTLYYDHWYLKMRMEVSSSFRLFLKCEQQPCKAGTHRNYGSQ